MPTSTYSNIVTVCTYLIETKPKSILDVGLGNGKMGFIARDLLDVMLGERHLKKDWEIKIDGIEIFAEYIQDHQKAIYNEIYIGDALKVIDTLGKYDMLYIGDVLEHFSKESAWELLLKAAKHSKKHIILSVPLGNKWEQPMLYGNEYEEHKSFWELEEFEPFISKMNVLEFSNIGKYGIFLINRDDLIHYFIARKSFELTSRNENKEAIDYLEEALKDVPPNISSEYILIDLLLNNNRLKDGVLRLKEASVHFPNDKSLKGFLDKLNVLPDMHP